MTQVADSAVNGRHALHDEVPLLHDYLAHSARRKGGKIALVCGTQRLSYRELDDRASALAGTLAARGVRRGDRVMIFGENSPEAVIAFWGALKANAVASIVDPLTRQARLDYLIKDCRPAALIADARLLGVWAEPAHSEHLDCIIVGGSLDEEQIITMPELAPKLITWQQALARASHAHGQDAPPRQNIDIDLAAILYTSGSTGDPKGVMLTHRNMLSAATSISACLKVREDEVILGALPLAFDYGLHQMIMAFRQGAKLVLEQSFSCPAQVLKTMVDEGVTGFPGVPAMFAMLVEMKNLADFDLSRIRYVTSTAAALPGKHIDLLRELFPQARICSMYGLTECMRCTCLPPEDFARKPASVGIAIPNTELWIVDEKGDKVGPNTVGQLVIRGATVMKGYWGKPEATAGKLKPGPLPGEQVLYTGDYCRLDEEGHLHFVSRMDDTVKSRGEKLAATEVGVVLCDIPGRRECAVIGMPDDSPEASRRWPAPAP